jgi:hypothetical protein
VEEDAEFRVVEPLGGLVVLANGIPGGLDRDGWLAGGQRGRQRQGGGESSSGSRRCIGYVNSACLDSI